MIRDIEGHSRIHIFRHILALGDCKLTFEGVCERDRDDGLYIFDWDKLEWTNDQVTTLTNGNIGSRAFHVPDIDVFGSPLNPDIECVNVKWPKCIKKGVDYLPVSGNF